MKYYLKARKLALLILITGFYFSACKNLEVHPEQKMEGDTYFSVKQFFDDQWATRHGQPITLTRISTFNGISDSAFLGLDSALWQNIRHIFDEADIGDPKFLGQYKFSLFTDDQTDITFLNYEAEKPNLFMRKMNIGMDQFTHKVRTLYIETQQKNRIYTRTQKLLYVPDKIIQIQEFEKSAIAPEKELKIEYIYS
jgi:hypothetical protein